MCRKFGVEVPAMSGETATVELRVRAFELALSAKTQEEAIVATIERAEKILSFLQGK